MAPRTHININEITSSLLSSLPTGHLTTTTTNHPAHPTWPVTLGTTTPSGSIALTLNYKRRIRLTLAQGVSLGDVQLEYNSTVRHWAAWQLSGGRGGEVPLHQIHGECRDNVIVSTFGFTLSQKHLYVIAEQVMAILHRLRSVEYEQRYPGQIEHFEPEIHSGSQMALKQQAQKKQQGECRLAHAFQLTRFEISPVKGEEGTSAAGLLGHVKMFRDGAKALVGAYDDGAGATPVFAPVYQYHDKWYGH